MGFSSQSGQIGFKTQASKGTYADPGSAGVFMRTISGSIGTTRELISTDPEIGGTRDRAPSLFGPVSYAGEFEFYARMNSLATLLQGAFGTASSSSTGATRGDDLVGEHTFTPKEQLPWLSVEEAIGDGLEVFNYTDAKVNAINFEVSPDGYLMGTAGLIAVDQTAGNTRTDLGANPDLLDVLPQMVGTSVSISIDGLTSYCVRDFSFDFTNNIEDDVYCLGSTGLQDLTPKRRELDMSATIRPEDINLWREAVYGSASATAPISGAAARVPVVFSVESYAALGTGTIEKSSLEVTVPHCNIAPFAIEPSGDDVIEYEVSFEGVKPFSNVDLCTVVVQNDLAAVA